MAGEKITAEEFELDRSEDWPDGRIVYEDPITAQEAFPVIELRKLLEIPQPTAEEAERINDLASSQQVVDYYAHRYWNVQRNLGRSGESITVTDENTADFTVLYYSGDQDIRTPREEKEVQGFRFINPHADDERLLTDPEYLESQQFMDRFAAQGGKAVREILTGKYGFTEDDFNFSTPENLLHAYFKVFSATLSFEDKQVADIFKKSVVEFGGSSLWDIISETDLERAADYAFNRMPKAYILPSSAK